MPLFKAFRKNKDKDHQSAPSIDLPAAPHKVNGSSSGGKPPLSSAKSEGFLKRTNGANNKPPKPSFRFGKGSKKKENAGAPASASSSNSSVKSNHSGGNDAQSQPRPVSPLKRNEVDLSMSTSDQQSSRSLMSDAPSPPPTTISSRNNSDDDNSSHDNGVSSNGSTTSASNFKKASLRRSGSSGALSNPKTLSHSTSAIGLDEMIEDRREVGTLGQNVVHIEVPFGKPIEEVYDGVHNGPVLGSGISGMVRLVTHKATGLKYAVKVLDLGLVETPTGLQQLREEIFIMCQLDHPNIVRLEEVYESHAEIYLVQELCLGGELFDRLDEQPDYHYTEAECARLVKQMLSAVRYLHSKGIIHRDLKLENFLFSSVHPDSELKMIDFGLSKHFRYGEVHHEAVGTPYTVAPEVIRGEYDERCDLWAIGVITFLLLSGEPPFGGCGGPEPLMTVRGNILQGRYAFEPADIWELVSPQALQFIQTLLVTDPSLRPTAKDAQKHEWFREWHKRNNLNNVEEQNVLNPNVVKALVNFKEFSDMRKLLCEVLSFTLLPDQIKDLRREFEKMDTDGSGEISLSALKQVLMKNAGDGSLGALTEEEVTDIFDAMRVRKTETRIHWHEFIAAGLSQCSVDDRNLRLAFERLDSDHKGYITLDDIMDLMGSDALQSEEEMRRMWGDSIKAVKCQHARITYDDFLLLMKGQTRENPVAPPPPAETIAMLGSSLQNLKAVPESDTLSGDSQDEELLGTPVKPETPEPSEHFKPTPTPGREGSSSAPATPADHKKIIDVDQDGGDRDEFDSPLSMDDELPVSASLTPPMTPERGANDYLSPRSSRTKFVLSEEVESKANDNDGLLMPAFPGEPYVRRRSRSLGQEQDNSNNEPQDDSENAAPPVPLVVEDAGDEDASGDLNVVADAVRDLILPEHEHKVHVPADLEEVVKDKSKSALVVNRRLYRAHRQMRMAVLEASKRFEEQQAQHAKEVILAQRKQQNELNGGGSGDSPAITHAGLVMRHGHTKQVSSEAIRTMLARDRAEQQSLVEKATRRGGRGRRSRKKTISDMSGMLTNLGGSEEFNPATTAAAANQATGSGSSPRTPPESNRSSLNSVSEPFTPSSSELSVEMMPPKATAAVPPPAKTRPPLPPPKPTAVVAEASPVPPAAEPKKQDSTRSAGSNNDAKEGTMRSPTIPGEFRKTSDPFGSRGKYGRPNWQ